MLLPEVAHADLRTHQVDAWFKACRMPHVLYDRCVCGIEHTCSLVSRRESRRAAACSSFAPSGGLLMNCLLKSTCSSAGP